MKWLGGVGGRYCAAATVSLLLGASGCGSTVDEAPTEAGAPSSTGNHDAWPDRRPDVLDRPSDGSSDGLVVVSDASPPVHDAGNPDGFPVLDPPAVACKDDASEASAADSPGTAEAGDGSVADDAADDDERSDTGDGVACELPPSVCASPDWLVYFVNPTCVAGRCHWEKSYYRCLDSPCVDGACRSRLTSR